MSIVQHLYAQMKAQFDEIDIIEQGVKKEKAATPTTSAITITPNKRARNENRASNLFHLNK